MDCEDEDKGIVYIEYGKTIGALASLVGLDVL